MANLNGDISGVINNITNFSIFEEESKNEEEKSIITEYQIPIPDIIRNIVHDYAQEPYYNIIIKDLDIQGLELLEYRYDIPMYLYRKIDSPQFENATLNGAKSCQVQKNDQTVKKSLDELQYDELDMLVNPLHGTTKPVQIYFPDQIDDTKYYVSKISIGDVAGYRMTDLIYPGELVANIGETLTSVLDKIVKVLGPYEYFYDIDGVFVFQKKRSFIETIWSPSENNQIPKEYDENNMYSYIFNQSELITAFNNTPNLKNLKNDFSIWGERTSVLGEKIPIHMRYAIDIKPTAYTNYAGTPFTTDQVDWREIIYQMAKDYYANAHLHEDFFVKIEEQNPDTCPGGRTGYEQYYTDIYNYWRTELYNSLDKTEQENMSENQINMSWNSVVFEHPETLNFWFDFLDTEGNINKYNVKNIGIRTKAINDSSIKSIYFRETPTVIYKTPNDTQQLDNSSNAYKIINVGYLDNMFSVSTQGLSAKDKLDELLYQHAYCIETANITTIPIYHLEPNTRIYINDQSSGIQGDYVINTITVPLSYNESMSITAIKAVNNVV